jgi:ABC-type glycerol-3-phosphate transport system permease component
MTCSTCGNALAQNARFCSRCGAQVSFRAQPGTVYAPSAMFSYGRVTRNIQTLGTLWLLYAGLRTLLGLVGVLFLHGIFGSHFHHSDFNFGWSPFGHMWMDSLLPIAFFSVLVGVGCTVLTGYALITRQPWGRVLAIIFAIFELFHFPVGTALGIYTLWVLAPRFSGDEYAAMVYVQHGS